jgi:hypothetical protein
MSRSTCPTPLTNLRCSTSVRFVIPTGAKRSGGICSFSLPCVEADWVLLHVVFDSLDRVAQDLFQAHGSGTVGLAEVFVDLIPVIHPRSGIAD